MLLFYFIFLKKAPWVIPTYTEEVENHFSRMSELGDTLKGTWHKFFTSQTRSWGSRRLRLVQGMDQLLIPNPVLFPSPPSFFMVARTGPVSEPVTVKNQWPATYCLHNLGQVNPCVLRFSRLQNGDNNSTDLIRLMWGWHELICIKALRTASGV